MPNKLAQAVAHLRNQDGSRPLMYCSATQMVSQTLEPLKVWPADIPRPVSFYNALIENVCVGCTMVINRETLELVKREFRLLWITLLCMTGGFTYALPLLVRLFLTPSRPFGIGSIKTMYWEVLRMAGLASGGKD